MDITAAHVEAARRELARRKLSDFACMVDIPTVPLPDAEDEDAFGVMRLEDGLAKHHALLCDALQRVDMAADGLREADGAIPNLMVLMPPGSAKSTYVDVVFVPWFMARKPRRHVILASYASGIAQKQGRRARQLIKSRSFANLMGGTALQQGQSAADEWALTNGSEYMAGGLLSGLTGNRAALGILDDPLRGREAAESETIRNKTFEAYQDDFCSRLIPGAPQVMILTRWHQDDPAGRILPDGWDGESGWFDGRDGRRWFVICIPAVADRPDDPLGRKIGESLWPEWFGKATGDPEDHWRPHRLNHRTWSSLYQQKPSPEDGTYFQGSWFKRYRPGDEPKRLNVYMTSDHAPGGGSEHDFNAFRVWGVDHQSHLWLLDGYRCQGDIAKAMGIAMDDASGTQSLAAQGALALVKKWKPLCWFPEDDNNWKSARPFVMAAMRLLKVRCRIEALTTAGGDKANKAQPFQAKAAMGEVHIPAGAEGDEIIAQYKSFPGGRWDDEIDCGANIGRALDMAHPAILRQGTRTVSENRDYGLEGDDGDDWRTV